MMTVITALNLDPHIASSKGQGKYEF